MCWYNKKSVPEVEDKEKFIRGLQKRIRTLIGEKQKQQRVIEELNDKVQMVESSCSRVKKLLEEKEELQAEIEQLKGKLLKSRCS